MTDQKGAVPLLILIAAIGIILVIAVTSFSPFKDSLFPSFYPVNNSFAATSVGRYDVFETTLTYSTTGIANPQDMDVVKVNAAFITPSNKTLNLEGFYYDVNTYKVRFTPVEIGDYTYSGSIIGPNGTQNFSGSFTSVPSGNKGFIRKLSGPTNRLVFEDGSVFYGAGMNECFSPTAFPLTGNIGDPTIEPIGESGNVDLDTFFTKYSVNGGYNLFRWNNGNCSFQFKFDTAANAAASGQKIDSLLSTAKKYGFHNLYAFYGTNAPFINAPTDPVQAAALKKQIRYVFARLNSYVDIWEWLNESCDPSVTSCTYSNASTAWLTYASDYLRTIDPYKRLITNSNPRTSDPTFLDFSSPHLYFQNWDWFTKASQSSLPMVAGEAGRAPGGAGEQPYNDAETNKGRLVEWTSFLGGGGVIWWNSSFRTGCCNQYLGSKERKQNKVLADFTSGINADFQAAKMTVPTPCVSAYRITSANAYGVYAYCASGILGTSTQTITTTFSLDLPFSGSASWINPETGAVIQTLDVTPGIKSFTSPGFIEDIALKITNSSASPSPSPIASAGKAGDISGITGTPDNEVDIWDYNQMLTDFGKTGSGIQGDIDNNGKVDIFDYNLLLTNFGV